jgi:hypothetical protein
MVGHCVKKLEGEFGVGVMSLGRWANAYQHANSQLGKFFIKFQFFVNRSRIGIQY